MIALDSVRLVALQFSFSNPKGIPASVRRLDRETPEERNERKNHSSGTMVIEPTENCSLIDFLDELKGAGYEMVDALYKKRIDPKDSRGRRTYHMVRFLFARREFVDLSEEFKAVRDIISRELRSICEVVMWRVRVFLNPFYENGEEVIGHRAISVNLESRKPLFCPDGQPVTVWQKDEKGNRVGHAPLPIKPDCCLRVKDNTVQLMVQS